LFKVGVRSLALIAMETVAILAFVLLAVLAL
jgi:hypothetical protein